MNIYTYYQQLKNTGGRSLLLLVIGVMYLGSTQAQESSNASGGDATGSGGTVAYSVGQVVYTTNTSTSGTVSQGVQQAYEIFKVGIKESGLDVSLSVFPNPTIGNLTLKISGYNKEKLSYQLYDMQGKLVNSGEVKSKRTQIRTEHLSSATYFLNIMNQQHQKVETYKIIKQ